MDPKARSHVVNELLGSVDSARRTRAVRRVTETVAASDVLVDGLRVRLSEAGPRVVAQANGRAAGRPIRVQVAAATLEQAAEDLADRLRERIHQAVAGWSARPWPDADDASVPSRVPPGERAVGPGLLARVKEVPPATCPAAAAAAVMDLLDYPVHLFVDADTGLDAVVRRAGPTGYRLARSRPAAPPVPNPIPLTVDPAAAPLLSPERAMARLDATGLGHLFFLDPETRRGQVLYRRFDARYALLKAAR